MFRITRARRAMWLEAVMVVVCAIAFLCALIFPLALAQGGGLTDDELRLLDAYQSGEIIRLHVVADSDAPESQRVKLCVRDALIDAFGGLLLAASETDADAVYDALLTNVSLMEQAARECARANGFDGTVTARAGVMTLPRKAYGSVVLPEGEYRALRVTLGSGQGRNWWCVLFPQLCLSLAGDEGEAGPTPAPELTWDTERIFSQWLFLPA